MEEPVGRLPLQLVSLEQKRRRTILLGIGVLLILALSPQFTHHLFAAPQAWLAGKDHLGRLCLVAIHTVLAPVHGLFHVLFLGGVLYATGDRLNAWRMSGRLLRSLAQRRPRTGDAFWNAATSGGLDPETVHIVRGLPTPAFTAGWIRPQVYVDRALESSLTAEQLAAVLAHEAAHVRRRDPLRLSLLRFLTCTLFWLPALRRLADDMTDDAEIQADNDAANSNPVVLASTIVAVARSITPASAPGGTSGFHRADLLERRVRRLLGEEPHPASHLTRRSLAGAVLALLLVIASGAVMAHPLPAEGETTAPHCQEHLSFNSVHLFCLDDPLHPLVSGAPCPHVYRDRTSAPGTVHAH